METFENIELYIHRETKDYLRIIEDYNLGFISEDELHRKLADKASEKIENAIKLKIHKAI